MWMHRVGSMLMQTAWWLMPVHVFIRVTGLCAQEDIQKPMGYAIQCRITSEDPELNFQPDSGRIQAYR